MGGDSFQSIHPQNNSFGVGEGTKVYAKGVENVFSEIKAGHSQHLRKGVDRGDSIILSSGGHAIVRKKATTNNEERLWKAVRNANSLLKVTSGRKIADFFTETLKVRRGWGEFIVGLERKEAAVWISGSSKAVLELDCRISTL